MGRRRRGNKVTVGAAGWRKSPPSTPANVSGKPFVKLSPKPVPKPIAKPTTKPSMKTSPKPLKSGSKPSSKTFLKPSTKPTLKPTAKPPSKPSSRPASRPAKTSNRNSGRSSNRKAKDSGDAASKPMPAPGQVPGPGKDQSQSQEDKVEAAESITSMKSIGPHRHSGVFLFRNSVDAIQLLTRNTSSSPDDYGEQRILADFRGKRSEFRSWSPFQSKLAAGIMCGVNNLHLHNGAKVLYLGAGFGRSVTHVSDIVGETGMVYAVERGLWSGRQLAGLASRRPNIVPVIEDATMPYKYCRQVPAGIDVIFSDLPQADQARSLMLNARHFLAPAGHFVAFLHGPSIESKVPPMEAFAAEAERLMLQKLKPLELVILEPFKPGYALVVGVSTRKNECS